MILPYLYLQTRAHTHTLSAYFPRPSLHSRSPFTPLSQSLFHLQERGEFKGRGLRGERDTGIISYKTANLKIALSIFSRLD